MNSDLVYVDQQALKKISYTYGVHSLIGGTVDGTRVLPCCRARGIEPNPDKVFAFTNMK